MFENLDTSGLSEAELWTLREAAGFYISIAGDREADGVDPPGTREAAEALAAAATRMDRDVQPLTQLEWTADDFGPAEAIARSLGYEQTAYTSSSALWGLFCLPENPATWKGNPRATQGGCIVKTRELGFLFVQVDEDLGFPCGDEEDE